MWSAPRGNPASARIPGGSCRTTPRRSSSGTRRRRAAWARNHRAHLERLRNQQRMLATDTPTTLLAVAMTHYELPGLGLDGRNVRPAGEKRHLRRKTGTYLVQIDAPFRSYLTSARALLRARSLEGLVGNWDRSDGLRPYLDPGLRPGFFGSRFGLSLEKGALGACQRAVIPRARSRAWQSVERPVPSTDS